MRSQAEKRLRAAFAARPQAGFRSEGFEPMAAAPAEAPAEADALVDVPRLRAGAALLELLAVRAEQDRGSVETSVVGDRLRDAAQFAERVVSDGPAVRTVGDVFRAELLIRADGTRPAALVRRGAIQEPDALGSFGELYVLAKASVDPSLQAAGRIDADGAQHGGGMLVSLADSGEPMVLTAAHVVCPLADGDGRLRPGCTIDFNAEIAASSRNRHVLGSIALHAFDEAAGIDYALVRLGAALDGASPPAPAAPDRRATALAPGETIAVVGFPARPDLTRDSFAPGSIWHRLFEGAWNVKRLSPGSVRRAPAGTAARELMWYDATTTAGSSGSGILSFGVGRVAGVHGGGLSEANRGISLAAIEAHAARRFG